MGTIVYTETKKDRRDVSPNLSQASLDQKFTVWQDARKVSISGSILRTGTTKSGKKWYKWGTATAAGFRYSTRGNIVPFQVTRASSLRVTDLWINQRPVMPFAWLDGATIQPDLMDAFRKAVSETFGIKGLHDIYPLAKEYDIHNYEGIPGNMRPGFRFPHIQDAAVVSFGKSRVNADWYKAIRETDPYIVAVAQQARGLVDDKVVLDFLKNNHFDEDELDKFQAHTPRLRPLLARMNEKSRLTLMGEELQVPDTKYIQHVCGDGQNLKFMMNKVNDREDYESWAHLLQRTTGRRF